MKLSDKLQTQWDGNSKKPLSLEIASTSLAICSVLIGMAAGLGLLFSLLAGNLIVVLLLAPATWFFFALASALLKLKLWVRWGISILLFSLVIIIGVLIPIIFKLAMLHSGIPVLTAWQYITYTRNLWLPGIIFIGAVGWCMRIIRRHTDMLQLDSTTGNRSRRRPKATPPPVGTVGTAPHVASSAESGVEVLNLLRPLQRDRLSQPRAEAGEARPRTGPVIEEPSSSKS